MAFSAWKWFSSSSSSSSSSEGKDATTTTSNPKGGAALTMTTTTAEAKKNTAEGTSENSPDDDDDVTTEDATISNKRPRRDSKEGNDKNNDNNTMSSTSGSTEKVGYAIHSTTTAGKKKPDCAAWKIVRLGAKDATQRKRDGGSLRSPQIKISCETLDVTPQGAIGKKAISKKSSWWFLGDSSGDSNTTTTIVDFNYYRSTGHQGRFTKNTPNRAIMICTVAAYDKLKQTFPSSSKGAGLVSYGDFGENILLEGPPATANYDNGLYVGAQVAIQTTTDDDDDDAEKGVVVLEITEANCPCYRFNTQSWAAAGQATWGDLAPDNNSKLWFKSPECPLNHIQNPGIRGWLAKVVTPGTVTLGDTATLVVSKEQKPNAGHDDINKQNSMVDDTLPVVLTTVQKGGTTKSEKSISEEDKDGASSIYLRSKKRRRIITAP